MRILTKVCGLKRLRLNAAKLSTLRHTMSHPDKTPLDPPRKPDNRILFTFGVVADVHYADIDDGYNYTQTRKRYYRNSISLLSDSIRHWNDRRDVAFVLQLGDIIDGYNKRNDASDVALRKTLDVCAQFNGPMYHVWGNHELYNFTKRQLADSQLNSSREHSRPEANSSAESVGPSDSKHVNYYHFSPAHGFRFVVIDTYDVGTLGYEPTSTDPQFVEAVRLLASKNPNEIKNSHLGLPTDDACFVAYNGGVGCRQLQWLRRVLETAEMAQEKVFIIGHIPLFADSSKPNTISWNSKDVLDVMHTFPACIVAYIAGHDHDGGQAVDAQGIQHITVEGLIETPPGTRAFANVHVYPDRVVVDGGGGRVTNTVIQL